MEKKSQQISILKTAGEVAYLIAYLREKEFVVFDTETTGLTAQDTIIGYSICAEPNIAYYVILQEWDKHTGSLKSTDACTESVSLFSSLSGNNLICHNGVFDCRMVEANFGISLIDYLHTDTMELAHVLNENRKVGLKELAKAYFGEDSIKEQKEMKDSVIANGGVLSKKNYEMYKADSILMAKYGAKDALLTYDLFYLLTEELFAQNLDTFFYEESMNLLRGPTYDLNSIGVQVDVKGLELLRLKLQGETVELKALILDEVKDLISEKYPGTDKKSIFNIGSNSHLTWLLFGKIGLEFGVLSKEGKTVCGALGLKLPYTFAKRREFIQRCLEAKDIVYGTTASGKPKKIKEPWFYIVCDKTTLKKYSGKHRFIANLLEYKLKLKMLNTYVENLEEKQIYGIIHPSFLQHGTTSGRYSSRNPNFQNLPRDDKRIKACVVARPGKVFVGADYSQLEPRVFAYTSQDENLMSAFNGTDDFYSVIGMRVYNKTDCIPQKEGSPNAFGIKYKKLRDLSKVIALASTYGATPFQLAPTTGKSIEDTEIDIEQYFKAFPGVARMMLESHEMAKTAGQVTNLFGRPRRIPEAKNITKLYGNQKHKDLPYQARQLLNLAVNHRIQSTGASIINRAAITFHNKAKTEGLDCKIVCQVHDSLIIECDLQDAEIVSDLLRYSMENTVLLPGVPLEALPKIGNSLAEV